MIWKTVTVSYDYHGSTIQRGLFYIMSLKPTWMFLTLKVLGLETESTAEHERTAADLELFFRSLEI